MCSPPVTTGADAVVLPAGMSTAVLDAGAQWARGFRSESSRSTRWAHLGLSELERGTVGGYKWIGWLLAQGRNPADCSHLPESLEQWGELLDGLVASDVIAGWTAYNAWSAARSWHRWARGRHGFGLPCDPYDDLDTSAWAFLVPEAVRQPEALTPEELATLIHAADRLEVAPVARRRAEALVSILAATGCRISEAAGMQRRNVTLRHDDSSGTVRYLAKRRRWRTADLPAWTCTALRRYLYARQPSCDHLTGVEPVFAPTAPPSAVWRPLGAARLAGVVGQVAEVANLEKRVTPHLIRGSLATEALTIGFSPYDAMAFTGHRKVASLEHYDRRQRGRKVAAHLHARIGGSLTN